MADLEAAEVGQESAVLIEARGKAWVLWARDDAGIVREVEVAVPTSAAAREDVAWLIVSLLDPSPTIDLGLPPRSARVRGRPPRLRAREQSPPLLPAVIPVAAAVEPLPVLVVEPDVAPAAELEPDPPPSTLLTRVVRRADAPLRVGLDLSIDYDPPRGPVLPFASLTATTEMRFRSLPTPAFELAAGVDIVSRVRVGLTVGGSVLTPVSWDPAGAAWTQAGSFDVLGFGSVGLDLRGRVRLGGAIGMRHLRYVPMAPGSVHVGEGELVPTVRVEGSYGFRLGRSLALLPTVGVQVDVLREPAATSRPSDMFPVSVRFGLKVVALRDVSFRLADLPPPPKRGRSKE